MNASLVVSRMGISSPLLSLDTHSTTGNMPGVAIGPASNAEAVAGKSLGVLGGLRPFPRRSEKVYCSLFPLAVSDCQATRQHPARINHGITSSSHLDQDALRSEPGHLVIAAPRVFRQGTPPREPCGVAKKYRLRSPLTLDPSMTYFAAAVTIFDDAQS